MPDISKCHGGTCPLRDRCYRFTSKPSEFRQAWLAEVPYGKVEPNACRFYMPNSMDEVTDVHLNMVE